MAYRMFKGAHVVVDPTRQLPSTPMQFMAGGGIGIASAILELGRKFNRSIFKPSWRGHAKAVATSAACGLPIAVAGAIGFMWFGAKEQISVPNTIGYVHIYAFIGISVMSFVTAKFGAKVAHALSPQMLKMFCLPVSGGRQLFYL